MAKTRIETFNENMPTITEVELLQAAQNKALVMSFATLPLAADDGQTATFLGVKLLLASGEEKTVLFDQWSCSLLCGAASILDKGQWLIRQSVPPGQTRQ